MKCYLTFVLLIILNVVNADFILKQESKHRVVLLAFLALVGFGNLFRLDEAYTCLSLNSVISNKYKRDENLSRKKRDVAGTLDIVTNHAQPIHADVKPEGGDIALKPCPETGYIPSKIEPGTVFKVTPPKDGIYEEKSLRKSYPQTSTVDLVRSVSRVVTLTVLLVTAILEFFPLIQQLYSTIMGFMN